MALRETIVVLTSVVILAGGCAHYEWQRAGATDGDLAQDKQECNRQARLLANEYELAFPGPGSWRYPYAYDTTRTIPNDRLLEEQRVYSACMRAKGYQLEKQNSESQGR